MIKETRSPPRTWRACIRWTWSLNLEAHPGVHQPLTTDHAPLPHTFSANVGLGKRRKCQFLAEDSQVLGLQQTYQLFRTSQWRASVDINSYLTPTLPPCSTHCLRKPMADPPSKLIHGSPSVEAPSTSVISSGCSWLYLLTGLVPLPGPSNTGAGTMGVLLSTQNPTQHQTMWMINKCLLNDTSFRSEHQDPLFSHGGRGKGKKRGKQDLLKRPKCKDLLVGHAGDGLSAQSDSPAWPRDLSRPAGPREQSADRSPNTPRLG